MRADLPEGAIGATQGIADKAQVIPWPGDRAVAPRIPDLPPAALPD